MPYHKSQSQKDKQEGQIAANSWVSFVAAAFYNVRGSEWTLSNTRPLRRLKYLW